MLLSPFHNACILRNDELDAVRHGLQAAQGDQAFHGGRQHVIHGLPEGRSNHGFGVRHRRNAPGLRHQQTDRHDDRQKNENAQHGEDHPGRLAAAANGQIPGDGHQRNADCNVNIPADVVGVHNRQQLVNAGEARNNNREDVVLQQHNRNHQAQARARDSAWRPYTIRRLH